MPDWPNLSAFAALVGLVLFLGYQFAKGKLWTEGQVDRLLADRDKRYEDCVRARDAAIERADVQGRDVVAMLARIVSAIDAPDPAPARHRLPS